MPKVRTVEEMSKKQLIAAFMKLRDQLDQVSKENEKLVKENYDLKVDYNQIKLKYDVLNAKYMNQIAARFQSQKNNIIYEMPSLFDDVEDTALKIEKQQAEMVEVDGYTKKKRVPKEQHISYKNLERRIVNLPVPEGEDICPACGARMHVKKYEEKEELVVIPAEAYVRVTRIPVLECVECQEKNEDGRSLYVPVSHPAFLYDRSKCSPELLAYIIDMRYALGLPLYALEKHFMKLKVDISRQNMCNWVLRSVQYIEPIFELMKEDYLSYPVNHADETVTQCLREDGKPATSTSYMFVYHTPTWAKQIVLFDYQASRSGDSARKFLKGFSGVLCTDAYSGYNKVENVVRSMCNVHALRKFKDAYKLLPVDKNRRKSEEKQAVRRYQEIFDLNNKAEQEAAKLYEEQEKRFEYVTKVRQEVIKPKFDEFLIWLEKIEPGIGRYQMKQAINYVLNNRKELTLFLEDARIPLSNQITEQSIRPFVVSRNRCKFYVSTTGADVSAKLYSLVITCTQNDINPYTYLMYLFKVLPNMDLTDKESLRSLLPYSNELPSCLKMLDKKQMREELAQYEKSKQKQS